MHARLVESGQISGSSNGSLGGIHEFGQCVHTSESLSDSKRKRERTTAFPSSES